MKAPDNPEALHRQKGSVLLLTVMVCLGLALLVQALAVVSVCAQHMVEDERSGRQRSSERDTALAALREKTLLSWGQSDWQPLETKGVPAEGAVRRIEGSETVMLVEVRQDAAVSRRVASAQVERGRDGIDLPMAAVVARSLSAAPGRTIAWLRRDDETQPAVLDVFLRELPEEPVGVEDCTIHQLWDEWRLDRGWSRFVEWQAEPNQEARGVAGVARGPGGVLVTGGRGQWISLEELLTDQDEFEAFGACDAAGHIPEMPVLVVVTGGAGLDAGGMGDLYGVLAVDGGSVRLDGTNLHGAVVASGSVELGSSGQVVFRRPLLRWACDRSLARTRLVPGTWREGTE